MNHTQKLIEKNLLSFLVQTIRYYVNIAGCERFAVHLGYQGEKWVRKIQEHYREDGIGNM